MADNLQHLLAASCYVMDTERAISSGRLPEDLEMLFRATVARTRIAFGFGVPAGSNDNDFLEQLAVHSALNREDTHV